ncbi:MAG: Quinone oxidoreductase 1 [Candidatus Heimdallarchaeota archaeon LC_3]|nr:MAG: Quinone oxidoreductase 1 [Candidatus Heimdallarchaeota archaeon LC_3]
MKAIWIEKYGPPEVIEIKEIDTPNLEADEMLVKVYASSINTVDTSARSGVKALFGLSRLMTGIRKPKKKLTGTDVAGEIVAIEKDITKFKIGDQIYGLARTGSCAEYAKVSERGVVLKPSTMNYSEAAAVPVAALTALQYLRDLGNIQDGQDILIYGASGGIGTFAIQYAKTFDVTITAVCSGKNEQLVADLGADKVIDYTKEDFTKNKEKYDIIFDTVGKSPQGRWKNALKEEGIFLQAGSPKMSLTRLFLQILGNRFRKKKMRFLITKTRAKDLSLLAKLIDEGKIKSVIDKSFSLDETAEAHRYYEKGHTVGKVTITIDHKEVK